MASRNLKIVADENLAQVGIFEAFGEVVTAPGRDIDPAMLKDADVLLIRSVTDVGPALLDGSKIRFVGSATSGYDHVDRDYLRERDIHFSHAPGCNANAVVQYVFCALAWLSSSRGKDWRNWRIGIVGAGNVGGLLARHLDQLGIEYGIYDPFLAPDSEHGDKLLPFEEVLDADVISLHCSLTKGGPHPTYHLFDADRINTLGPWKTLINTARGEVVDNAALTGRLRKSQDLFCVFDTWENEPAVDKALLSMVLLGTPHIAGYSEDGKLRGTWMIHDALSRYLGEEEGERVQTPAKTRLAPRFDQDVSGIVKLNHALLTAYDVFKDHESMQELADSSEPERVFDQLRKQYPRRREFQRYTLDFDAYPEDIRDCLASLGFSQA